MKKLLFIAAFLVVSLTANAQLFGDKMPVGVKNYSILVEGFDLEFKDVKGTLDKYEFGSLDNSLSAQKIVIVKDRKKDFWRLPLTLDEARGIASKDGEEPLERMEIILGEIRAAKRDKIE
jgi:hypothetical protein